MMTVQPGEHTKSHKIVHFERMISMICELYLNVFEYRKITKTETLRFGYLNNPICDSECITLPCPLFLHLSKYHIKAFLGGLISIINLRSWIKDDPIIHE